jgi:putative FmdB family regulatory protein
MPTYEYVCDGCGHEFEEFQYFSDEPLTDCPECKKKKLRRLFGTGAAVLFKGSGFYQTDYPSESYKSGAKSDKPADSSGKDGKTGDGGKKKPSGSAESS